MGWLRERHLRRARCASRRAAGAAPTVSTRPPANGATDVPPSASVSVTFSEPVDVAGNWFTLVCSSSGAKTASVTRRPDDLHRSTRRPTSSAARSCTFTVLASSVTDQDVNDPPDAMAADFVDRRSRPATPTRAAARSRRSRRSRAAAPSAAITGSGHDAGRRRRRLRGPVARRCAASTSRTPGRRRRRPRRTASSSSTATPTACSLGDLVRSRGTAAEFQDQTQITRRSRSRPAAPARSRRPT